MKVPEIDFKIKYGLFTSGVTEFFPLVFLVSSGQLSEDRRKFGCSIILKMKTMIDWPEFNLLSVINSFFSNGHATWP